MKEPAKDSPTRAFWRDFWKLLKPFRRSIYRTLGWIVAMQTLALVEPYLIMFILDDVTKNGLAAKPRVIPMAACAFGLFLLTTLAKILKDRAARKAASDLVHDVPLICQQKLLKLPLAYHQAQNTGEIVSSVNTGTHKIMDLMWMGLYEFIPNVIQLIIVVGTICYFHWMISVITLVAIVSFWVVTIMIKRKLRPYRTERHVALRNADHLLAQSVMNVMTTQAFNQEAREEAAARIQRDARSRIFEKEHALFDRWAFGRNSLINLARVVIVVVCTYLLFAGHLTLGQVVFASMLTDRLLNANFMIGGMYDRVMEAIEPVEVITKLMDEPERVMDSEEATSMPNEPPLVRFEGVSYAYPTQLENPALRDISLDLKSGTMVGIVGESGHGKSTLAKLLLRFDDPTIGSVKLNGIDFQKLRKADLRKLIGYVPQEVELYDDSIKENIRYGKPDATDEEVERAAKLASAHEFISQLENGYDTMIGNRGLRLSGGQRQRVGIARAILTDPKILIFDEATSSVDPETIYAIKESMRNLRKGRTFIVITHQVSTIQDADRIIVLRDGRIDGIGHHGDLLRSNDVYRRFVQRQQNSDAALTIVGPDQPS